MPLTQLRYFYEVARTGSIREASARLSVTPSSISRQIQNLEHEVRMPLFERQARGMTLTSAGELYMAYARSVLLELDRLYSDIDDLRGLRRGRIRIHTIEGIVADTLLAAVAQFRERFPGVTFEVMVTGTDLIAVAVQSGD
jgi:DNA-binding transcriptional LysR family regulator